MAFQNAHLPIKARLGSSAGYFHGLLYAQASYEGGEVNTPAPFSKKGPFSENCSSEKRRAALELLHLICKLLIALMEDERRRNLNSREQKQLCTMIFGTHCSTVRQAMTSIATRCCIAPLMNEGKELLREKMSFIGWTPFWISDAASRPPRGSSGTRWT